MTYAPIVREYIFFLTLFLSYLLVSFSTVGPTGSVPIDSKHHARLNTTDRWLCRLGVISLRIVKWFSIFMLKVRPPPGHAGALLNGRRERRRAYCGRKVQTSYAGGFLSYAANYCPMLHNSLLNFSSPESS